jgi:hypothetical protein
MRYGLASLFGLILSLPAIAKEEAIQIKIIVNTQAIMATLNDSPSAKDFASLLPLTVTLDDYAKTEKVSNLPRKLTKEDASATMIPKRGDITSYTPWGNLAIFYRDGYDSPGLVKLGHIDSGIEALEFSDSKHATIELVKP